MKKIHLLFFVILLGLGAFYDGSCGRSYTIGWPIPLISYDYPHLDEKSHFTLFQEDWAGPTSLPLAILVNLTTLIAAYFLLKNFFESQFYSSRAEYFRLSNRIVFGYALVFTLIGWSFILFNTRDGTFLQQLSYLVYLYPVLYTGGLIVLFVNKYTFDVKPFTLMPIAYLLSLIVIYFFAYFLMKLSTAVICRLKAKAE